MRAGKLNNLVTLQRMQQQDPGPGEYEQAAQGWTNVASLWADIRFQNGLETVKGGAETSIARASIRIRYRDGITAGMRILHGVMAYNIKAVLPDVDKKRHIDMVCEVVT